MNEKPTDLASALVEVREAYRLLHAYHRRLCDLFQVVDEFLEKRDLKFQHWAPLNVARIPQSTRPFFRPGQWAWDLTPAYQVESMWLRAKNGSCEKVHLHAIADTGYKNSGGGEPVPSDFEAAQDTCSVLRVGLYHTKAQQPDWDAAWSEFSKLKNRTDGNPHAVDVGTNRYIHRYFKIDLANLADEKAVKELLLQPLEAWVSAAG